MQLLLVVSLLASITALTTDTGAPKIFALKKEIVDTVTSLQGLENFQESEGVLERINESEIKDYDIFTNLDGYGRGVDGDGDGDKKRFELNI